MSTLSRLAYLSIVLVFVFSVVGLAQFPVSFDIWQDPACSRQCHGDADCAMQGPFWISTNDLAILQAVMTGPDWPAYYPESINYDPRADFDRNFRVDDADVAILEYWGGHSLPPVPADCGKKLELHPIVGQCLVRDSNYTIEWQWQIYTDYIPMPGDRDNPGPMQLYYSLDYGDTWNYIDTVSSGYSYEWTVPHEIRTHLALKIVDINHPDLTDITYWWIECQSALPNDLNGDCYVDFVDYALQVAVSSDVNDLIGIICDWLKCANPCDPYCNNP